MITPTPVSTPRLSEDQIFELVHEQIAAVIGESGEWALTRRADDDTDTLFRGVIAHSLATHVVAALNRAQADLSETRPAEQMGVAAVPSATPQRLVEKTTTMAGLEPAAVSWQPAPITVWTDLKKPVTGEIARIREEQLVA